ncbi:MAG: OmpA family protein [Microcoleaceae cyanobacterium MO_207.B10]|nr:OmpA family protein [Microcoleaceae cyanobacterium MO_207.B10]
MVICGWAFAQPNAFKRPNIGVQATEDVYSDTEETAEIESTETSELDSTTTTETPETDETTTTTASTTESITTTEVPETEQTTTTTADPISSSPSPVVFSGEQSTTDMTNTATSSEAETTTKTPATDSTILTTAAQPETESPTVEQPTTDMAANDMVATSESQTKTLNQPETLGKIEFEINIVELSPQAEENIQDMISKIKQYNPDEVVIRVEGHTSSIGGAELNQEISQDRANVVVEYLKQQNIPYQVVGEGMGSSQPLSGTDPADDVNQRTVIILSPNN